MWDFIKNLMGLGLEVVRKFFLSRKSAAVKRWINGHQRREGETKSRHKKYEELSKKLLDGGTTGDE